ncbi:hypothetical protein [Burkholderia multivorans]|uniref:hypothetical protein n=1 Tax=Burkholderia multivorans TaxID=87883 RepID=UPI001590C791|nr:hypothetical protein [Burkholderia multivorans]
MVQFDPMKVAAFDGIFNKGTEGVTQGEIQSMGGYDRFHIEGGYSIDSKSLYGGLPVNVGIAAKGAQTMGSAVRRATTAAEVSGFVISTQMFNAIQVPGGAGVVSKGMGVQFGRFGSGVRVAVQIDPALAETLYGGGAQPANGFGWDYTNNKLIAAATAADKLPITVTALYPDSFILVEDAVTGFVSQAMGAAAVIQL